MYDSSSAMSAAFALILQYIGPFLAYFAYYRCLSHHIGPEILTSAYLRAAMLGANWVY
jgi:hypothetical protein